MKANGKGGRKSSGFPPSKVFKPFVAKNAAENRGNGEGISNAPLPI